MAALAPSLRQYELDQVQRVTALPSINGPAESQPLGGTPLVTTLSVIIDVVLSMHSSLVRGRSAVTLAAKRWRKCAG